MLERGKKGIKKEAWAKWQEGHERGYKSQRGPSVLHELWSYVLDVRQPGLDKVLSEALKHEHFTFTFPIPRLCCAYDKTLK